MSSQGSSSQVGNPVVGVLAIQGDFAAHGRVLDRLGIPWRDVRTPQGLAEVSGLIIPGGESTTMLKFLQEERFIEPLTAYLQSGGAVFGTCAGAILMSKDIANPPQPSLGLLDISIQRNAYGRQVHSFVDAVLNSVFGPPPLELVFIRAPIITRTGPGVEVLIQHQGHPVLVRQDRYLASTFHPELTADPRVHELFLSMIVDTDSVDTNGQ